MKVVFLTCALLATGTSVAKAAKGELGAPQGIRWGASPQEVQAQLQGGGMKFLGPQDPAGNPDLFMHEQRYEGDVLGMRSDHVAPLFFAGQFFALAVSYSPDAKNPATKIWQKLVDALSAQFGKPDSRTKPTELLSREAVLRLVPDEANRGQLMELYNAADADKENGRSMILDLQVRVGVWVPEAIWRFKSGASVKAVMRATGSMPLYFNLKPAVIYVKPDQLR